MTNILGIDNGLDGALVLLDSAGKVLHRRIMPTITVKDSKREYDEGAIVRLIRDWQPGHVILEKAQSMPEQGVASTFSIGKGYGLIRGILAALEMPYTLAHPRTWQGVIFRDLPKSDTKAMSVIVAGRLWPAVDWRASDRCKKPHDGLTDAACIAEYGRRTLRVESPRYDYSKPLTETNEETSEAIFASIDNRVVAKPQQSETLF